MSEENDVLSLSLTELYASESQAVFDQRAKAMYRLDVRVIRRLESDLKQMVMKVDDQTVILSLYELAILLVLREQGTATRAEMYKFLWNVEPNKRQRPPISASIRSVLSRMLRNMRDHGLIKELEFGLFTITLRGNAVMVEAHNWLVDQYNAKIEGEPSLEKDIDRLKVWLKNALLTFRGEHFARMSGEIVD
jgi:hypothetical protein